MSEKEQGAKQEEKRSTRESFGDGVRAGIGILTGFKEAIEETINEARDRGDLSPERAKEIARTAIRRAQDAAEDARERFDFASRTEVDALADAVEDLQRRVESLERELSAGSGEGQEG